MENGIDKEEKTTISSSTIIDGNIETKEHLTINGTINGNVEIKGYNLFLGSNGKLEGEVHANNVKISGHMRGDIYAIGKVEITHEADFSGSIKSKGITVEKGAYFDAFVDLGQKPSGTPALKETSTAK